MTERIGKFRLHVPGTLTNEWQKCVKCGQRKRMCETYFYKKGHTKTGYDSTCISCYLEHASPHAYSKNRIRLTGSAFFLTRPMSHDSFDHSAVLP